MLTLLPALLAIGGRRAFWPFIPRFSDGVGVPEEQGVWRRLGDGIARRPRPVWIATLAGLLVPAVGIGAFDTGISQQEDFRGQVESVRGQELLAASFAAGSSAPTRPDRARTLTRRRRGGHPWRGSRPWRGGRRLLGAPGRDRPARHPWR